MTHLALIDGSGFVYRSFFAGSELKRSDGLPVGALRGFCWQLNTVLKRAPEDGITHMAVVLDSPGRTFRHKLYPEYKANRKEKPEALKTQLGLIPEAVHAFGLNSIRMDGYEADDLIATYANAFDGYVTIVSQDKDLMQLVTETITIYDPKQQKTITQEDVKELHGVWPGQMIDYQALVGDATDNIPGAKGIGPKIAANLINEYGDLDTLLLSTDQIKQKARRESLEQAGQIFLSQELVRLRTDLPIKIPMHALVLKPIDTSRLRKYFRQMEFSTLEKEIMDEAA